jgi:hypothetical protein
MKWLVMVAALLLAFAPQAGAQEVVTEEIEVVVWGLPAFLQHDCPIDDRGRIQTYAPLVVTCKLRALDADLLWTPATFAVEVLGPTGRVEATVADSTLTMNLLASTGLPGVRIVLTAAPVVWPRAGGGS